MDTFIHVFKEIDLVKCVEVVSERTQTDAPLYACRGTIFGCAVTALRVLVLYVPKYALPGCKKYAFDMLRWEKSWPMN